VFRVVREPDSELPVDLGVVAWVGLAESCGNVAQAVSCRSVDQFWLMCRVLVVAS
jgi:hypothetical protein